jgi:cell filamentation protein
MTDPYTYPGTNVLINRFGIRDKATLDLIEGDITADLTHEMLVEKDKLIFSTTPSESLLKLIHKHMFTDIYAWAGQYRTAEMGKPEPLLGNKSVEYSPITSIIDDDVLMKDKIKQTFKGLSDLQADVNDREKYIDGLAKLTTDLWVAQPFIAGSTRVISLFTRALVAHHGLELSGDLTDKQSGTRFRDMLVKASAGDYSDLKKSLARCVQRQGSDDDLGESASPST